ncbi:MULTISPECIES: ABC transporter permease [unclassified Streptomyces]|uniref:ABC transporter permease n=1 Tax=unclassified Streptomyces TaxID=2593676 RepID=UPI002E794B38|nr:MULTISPECIES: ABC transporter permease subunit [unclassified Streptomyces]MEE1765983.1 ABC transporter permease subunit [Streptomyces sp. SP18BB07]MEE1832293.1 ABC transporter permease subunit [Streptomyces sp. SP17KL33]
MSTLTERAEHAPPESTRPVEVADGYRAGRTLPLRVELVRQLKRRRTMVMFGILFALPLVLLIAFQVGGSPGEGNNRVNLMDTATASGANFAAVNLFAAAGFLLVIPVALFCGDTVASEASWSSLRYLLAAPVPRARLLWSKLVVGLTLSLAALVLLPVVALAVGTAAYGWGPLELPTGGELAAGAAAQALVITVAYIFVSQLVTAAMAFWLSTRTDAPLGAVGGAVGLTIVGSVLDEVTALGDWRHFLPTHWQYAWLDVVRPQPEYTDMIQGVSISITYALVLFALAFRGFGRKDVVS